MGTAAEGAEDCAGRRLVRARILIFLLLFHCSVMKKSMSLEHESSSEPLHVSAE